MSPDTPNSATPPESIDTTDPATTEQQAGLIGTGLVGSTLFSRSDDAKDSDRGVIRKKLLGGGLAGSSLLATAGTANANTNGGYLIIKDCNPWRVDPNRDVLRDMGAPTNRINSDQLGSHSLSSYEAVVIPSTQSSAFYERLANHRNELADFVSNGGTLFAHIADSGWPCTTSWNETFLPRGVNKVTDYRDSISIEQISHPIASGLSDGELDNWGYSAHGYLTNVPDDATTVFSSHGDPTYVEYEYGSGVVLATMQTIEWPWYCGCGSRNLLRNELGYDGEPTVSRSGKATTLSTFPGISENSSDGGDELNSALPDFQGTAVDDWFHGDYWQELPQSLQTAKETYKEPEEFDSATFHKYRHENRIEVSFEATETKIVEGSVEVQTNDDPVYITLEEEDNPLRTVKEVLFDGDDFKSAVGRDRYESWELTEIGDVEAVRVSTIWGTYDPYVEILLEHVVDNSFAALGYLLFGAGGAVTGLLAELIASTPAIYTWVEYFHLADGRELIRVPDASRYPRHAGYLGDDKVDRTNFHQGEEYDINEDFNGRFNEWVAETQTHLVTPYESPHSAYLDHFENGIPEVDSGPHPVMVSGTDEEDNELNSSIVKDLLPDDYLSPF